MICPAKPVLTEDLCLVKKEEFSITCAKCTLADRSSIFIREKPILRSERMLHKDYYRKGSVEKKSLVVGLKGLDAKTN
jgi:hypothetical protein